MGKVTVCLTVYFEDPFWVGVFERYEERRLTVCKVTFGTEPKDHDVYARLLKHWDELRFSPAVAAAAREKRLNPKRVQREVKKQVSGSGIGTRSQQALKLQQEQNKRARKTRSRAEKQAEEERMFDLKQQKKREKHRGH